MDFRSQLSAFANKCSSSRGGGGQQGGGDDRGRGRGDNRSGDYRGGGGGGGGYGGDRGRSPNSRSPNYNRYNNSNNSGGGGNYYGRGGGGGGSDGHSGGDNRRRQRPGNWNHHQQGPPNQRRRHNSPDRDGLGGLRSFGYRIPRGVPPPPTPEAKAKKAKHIALLAITIDDMPYEHIWKAWCQTIDPPDGSKDDYFISLVCHAKYPKKVQSDWLKQRMLVYPPKVGRGNSYLDPDFMTRTPDWGSVDITRAMLDLLLSGLKIGHCKQKDMRFSANRFLARRPIVPLDSEEEPDDSIPPVDQFIYISETCVPVVSAQEMFQLISDTTVSWVNARHRRDPDTPKNAYENDQFGLINRRIPGQFRWKADQWVLLCRHHAQQIMNMDRPNIPPKHQLWQSFRDINASDEMYIPTCLAMLGWLRYAGDGEDTQKSRGEWRVRTDSNATDGSNETSKKDGEGGGSVTSQGDNKAPETAGAAAVSTTAATGEKQSTTDGTASTTVVVKQAQRILKRPVTYTDWSEGMRNPATFVKGLTDFQRVSRLARKKGCLVARKFAPYEIVPGMAVPDDQNATGQFTVEEWKHEIELLAEEFKVEVSVEEAEEGKEDKEQEQEDGEEADNSQDDDNDNNAERGNNNEGSDSSSGEEEENEESFLAAGGDGANHDEEDAADGDSDDQEDDEEEENQL